MFKSIDALPGWQSRNMHLLIFTYIYIYVIFVYVYFDVFISVFKTPFRFSPTHKYLESTSTGYLVHAVCVMQFSILKFGAFYFWKIILFVSAGHFVANQFVFEFWVLVPPQACWFYSSEIGGFRWCSGFLLFSKGIHLCKDCYGTIIHRGGVWTIWDKFPAIFRASMPPCLSCFPEHNFPSAWLLPSSIGNFGCRSVLPNLNRATNMGTFSMVTWWTKSYL